MAKAPWYLQMTLTADRMVVTIPWYGLVYLALRMGLTTALVSVVFVGVVLVRRLRRRGVFEQRIEMDAQGLHVPGQSEQVTQQVRVQVQHAMQQAAMN